MDGKIEEIVRWSEVMKLRGTWAPWSESVWGGIRGGDQVQVLRFECFSGEQDRGRGKVQVE